MVNKKIIEKLSDRELENYIKPDSRFVAMAVSYAYEILQSRGKTFADAEKQRIEQMISDKKADEEAEKIDFSKDWDENMTANETAIELYSNRLIWIFSLIFGVIFGAVLQAMNFSRLQNKKGLYLSLLFGILYTIAQIYLLTWIEQLDYQFPSKFNNSKTFLFSASGALILGLIREQLIPKDLEYRSRSFVSPLIIAILIYIPIVYIIISGI